MFEPREELALVLAPDLSIFAIGGQNDRGVLSTIEKFEPETQSWTLMNFKKTKGMQAVAHPDGIYIIGGHDGHSYLNTLDRLDPVTGKQTSLPPMNIARSNFQAVLS